MGREARASGGDRRSQRGAHDRDDLATGMLHPPSGRGIAPYNLAGVRRLTLG